METRPDGLQVRTRVRVSYAGDLYLHDRVILSLPALGDVCVATAHHDLYVEPLAAWTACFLRPRSGGVPPRWRPSAHGVNAGKVVRFDEEEFAENIDSWCEEAEQLAPSQFSVLRLDGTGDPIDVSADAGAGALLPHSGFASAPDTWIAMEDRDTIRTGDPVSVVGRRMAITGDRALCTLDSGLVIALAQPGTWTPPVATSEDDPRTLSVHYGRDGERLVNFCTAVGEVAESTFPDWGVSGPRTTKWILTALRS